MFITGFAAVVLDGGRAPLPRATLLSKPFHLRELVGRVEAPARRLIRRSPRCGTALANRP